MAQLNITLNQEEILQLLAQDRNETFKSLWQNALNSILKIESEVQLQAAPYERTENRTDSRNGFRHKDLQTQIGTHPLPPWYLLPITKVKAFCWLPWRKWS